jgi:hypothetical protein
MPKAKRERRERTDNYHLLQQWRRTPEQRLYEGIRPVVLFGIPPAERAQETGLAERSLGRAADAFDTAYQCETAECMEPDELLAGCRQFVRLHAPSEWPS